MDFYFCEDCGKRITELDIGVGAAKNKKLKGVFCKACAVGVTTMETQPLTDQGAHKILNAQSNAPKPRPRRKRRTSAISLQQSQHGSKGNGTEQATHAKPNSPSSNPALFFGVAGAVLLLLVGVLIGTQTSSNSGSPTNRAKKKRAAVKESPPSNLSISKSNSQVQRKGEQASAAKGKSPKAVSELADSKKDMKSASEAPSPIDSAKENESASIEHLKRAEEKKAKEKESALAQAQQKQKKLLEEKKREVQRMAERQDTLFSIFDTKLMVEKDYAGARSLLTCTTRKDTGSSAAVFEELDALANTYDEWDALVIKGLNERVGKKVKLQTLKGLLNGTLMRTSKNKGVYKLEERIGKRGQGGIISHNFKVEDLSASQRNSFLASWAPSQTSHWLALGLRQAAALKHEKAAESLANAVASPLHAHYKRVLRRLQIGGENSAAEEAWQAIVTASAGKLKHDRAEKLKGAFKTFLKAHGKTEFTKGISGKVEELKDKLAAAALPSSFTAEWVKKNPKAITLDGKSCKGPPAKTLRGAGYDLKRKLGILYGSGQHPTGLNDLWAYDLSKNMWTRWLANDPKADGESRPKARSSNSLIATSFCCDADRDRYWLTVFGFLWSFDPNVMKWKKEKRGHSSPLGYDPKARSLITSGGIISMPEGYESSVPEAKDAQRAKAPKQLLESWGPSTVMTSGSFTADEEGNVLAFGAYYKASNKKAKSVAAETWSFSPLKGKWVQIETKDSPAERIESNLAYNRRLKVWVLFGGYAKTSHLLGSKGLNDTWVYVPHSKTWLQMEVKTSPKYTGATWYDAANDAIVLFTNKGDTWVLKIKPSFD